MAYNDTVQAIADAIQDAQTLEEVVNGNETKQVTTRLGENYPSVKKAIKTLFENGGLPAAPFATKALMTASGLADGKYAVVTDDSGNNGLYVKTAGAWVKSSYSPIISTAEFMSPTDTKSAQSGKSISDYLDDIGRIPTTNPEQLISAPLSKYTGASDPTLITGRVSNSFSIENVNPFKICEIIIPDNVATIKRFNLKTAVNYVILTKENGFIAGGRTNYAEGEPLPANAYKIRFTCVFDDPLLNQDFTTNNVEFVVAKQGFLGNKYLRKNDVASLTSKPSVKQTEYLYSSLPDFSNAAPPADMYTNYDLLLFAGYVSSSGVLAEKPGAVSARISVPRGVTHVEIKSKAFLYTSFLTNANQVVSGTKPFLSETVQPVPSQAKFILVGIKNGAVAANLADDRIVFYHGSPNYVLNDVLGRQLVNEVLAEKESSSSYGKIMLGMNQYTIEGLDFRVYPSSLFSGFCPTINFNIELSGQILNKGHFAKILSAGQLGVTVYDTKRILIEQKVVNIHKKPMPTTLNKIATSSNKLQALFIGDSLIHNNQNLIGKEWLRMLNTDAPTETVVGNVVYPPTFNLGKGNIELVGNLGTVGQKYEIGNKLSILMTGTGAVGSTAGNPFYNPNSTEPNEIGADGWHKRVDIAWYLQKVCGAGKYPSYIYLACGVNDIVDYNWDVNALPTIRANMKSLLGRIKAACDAIAGGNSNVQILLMNHQFYPLNEGAYSKFSPAHQRRIWAEHYDKYEKMIANDTVDARRLNTYVRFVDCASSFDIDYGYTYVPERANPRNTQTINTIVDTVHIGVSGSGMYADALLRDFLYHECS